jgi:hypothetical protein
MRNQRRSATMKPADAPSPHSMSAFQRSAHRPIRYWVWTRFSDALAGFMDRDHHKPEDTPTRTRQHDPQASTASSPWLHRLSAEYAGAVEEERLAAMAAISVLSARWVGAEQAASQAATDAALMRARHTELESTQVDPAPVTAGERYESDTAILSRRLTALRRQRAEVSAELVRLAKVQADSAAAMATCADAISAHWNALAIRTAALSKHYTRRAGTYTRWFRNWRVPNLRPPVMAAPSWAQDQCPWSPPAVSVSVNPLAGGNGE